MLLKRVQARGHGAAENLAIKTKKRKREKRSFVSTYCMSN